MTRPGSPPVKTSDSNTGFLVRSDWDPRVLREAHQVLPTLRGRRAVLLTLRRLHAPPEVVSADRMAAPGRRLGARPASSMETPQ
ncbi:MULTISPECIES: hypothetical protein [Streptomyces]|uniref:hypothetical protein n=1 Tax=Streptomyces TaxID=1883 RepID=UPI00131D92A3|nr:MULTISPECIES: hypothetical protein [Streptomyces]